MSGQRPIMRTRFFFLLIAGSLCADFGHAQTTGSIGGWINDSSGAALSGVVIDVASPSLQGHRSTVTAKDGTYRLPALPPGRYTLRNESGGIRERRKKRHRGGRLDVDHQTDPADCLA